MVVHGFVTASANGRFSSPAFPPIISSVSESPLQTKLYTPPIRPKWVARLHLLAELPAARPIKLVLVSAPAGYGKITLMTAWLHQVEAAVEAHIC